MKGGPATAAVPAREGAVDQEVGEPEQCGAAGEEEGAVEQGEASADGGARVAEPPRCGEGHHLDRHSGTQPIR